MLNVASYRSPHQPPGLASKVADKSLIRKFRLTVAITALAILLAVLAADQSIRLAQVSPAPPAPARPHATPAPAPVPTQAPAPVPTQAPAPVPTLVPPLSTPFPGQEPDTDDESPPDTETPANFGPNLERPSLGNIAYPTLVGMATGLVVLAVGSGYIRRHQSGQGSQRHSPKGSSRRGLPHAEGLGQRRRPDQSVSQPPA